MGSFQASTKQVYLQVPVRRSGKVPYYNVYSLSLLSITTVSVMAILNKIKLTFNCAEVTVNLRGVFRKIALLRVVFTEPKESIYHRKANKM